MTGFSFDNLKLFWHKDIRTRSAKVALNWLEIQLGDRSASVYKIIVILVSLTEGNQQHHYKISDSEYWYTI